MYDVLVIGGGTAGVVVASRLSENPAVRVCLVEAGPDLPSPLPDDVSDLFPRSTANPDYLWTGLMAGGAVGAAPRPYSQARVVGGGSSINGMFALRGLPSDYDGWAQAGASGWAWQDVAPWFDRVEGDGASEALRSGPNTITRLGEEHWPAYARALGAAARRHGYPGLHDANGGETDGFFAMPTSGDDGGRLSTPRAYLSPEVRSRSNLTIMANSEALALTMDGRRVRGATVAQAGLVTHVDASRVIVCAGALHSPTLLMCSGIGPADALVRAGIAPLVELDGVGENLQNHPYLFYAMTLPARSRMNARLRNFVVAGLRATSRHEASRPGDLLLFATGRVSPSHFGTGVAMLGMALYAPYSRGRVTIETTANRTMPVVDFRMFEDPRDAPRLIEAVSLARTLLSDPAMKEAYNDVFMLPPGQAVNQFSVNGVLGRLLSAGAELTLHMPGTLRRLALGTALGLPASSFGLGRDPDASLVTQAAVPMGHPAGTCAMGSPSDSRAVVDPGCRVIGAERLYVADASIMPVIPTANTNLPTVMVAERAAAMIARDIKRAP